jgi:hypothetical protein
MAYTPEEIREKVLDRLEDLSTKHGVILRSPFSGTKDTYPAYILEFGANSDIWSGNKSNQRRHMFNLYIMYAHDNTEAQQELAELAISECIGELYNVVFSNPTLTGVSNGWIKASDVTWGYGDTGDVPTRMAMLQLEVTVHETR